MTEYCTCLHLAVDGRGPVQHQTLDLQELIRLVAPDDGEAEPTAALLQLSVDEGPLELGRVPSEERLPSCGTAPLYQTRGPRNAPWRWGRRRARGPFLPARG